MEEVILSKNNLENKVKLLKQHKDEWLTETKSKMNQQLNKKRSQIMKSKKGLYFFYWRHERKSWTVAKKPIYFDLGDGYLFRKISNSLVEKISVENFLLMFKSRKINQK